MSRFGLLLLGEGRTARFLVVCMALGFASLLIAGIAAVRVIEQNQRHAAAVSHSYDVELAIADFNVAVERAETGQRGFLITGARSFFDRYRAEMAQARVALEHLRSLTGDNREQQARIVAVDRLMRTNEQQQELTNALVAAGSPAEGQRRFAREGDALRLRAIRARTGGISAAEQQLLRERDAEQRGSVRSFFTLLTFAGVLLVLLAVVSFLAVRRYTLDLTRAGDQLRGLNGSLESVVAERTAELRRANEEIQRFAYIVSHDLRSPLVNVMGFTAELEAGAKAIAAMLDRVEAEAPQLVDTDAKEAARIDLPEAIGFIRTSTAKMDRLINAILKLSREGRRVITPEPIDMAALVASVRDTLQHRLDETGGTVEAVGTLPTIVTDRVAIEQIVSNVIENAVKYAAPERPIHVRVAGRTEGARAIFTIADNGRGIDPRDHDRIFDLFRRSGRQDQPGEGIGLAHVRALTYRLGGVIDVASTLGSGATFSITLPLRYNEALGSGS